MSISSISTQDRLQKLLSGEPAPQLPDWNPKWDLPAYEVELERFHRRLLEYIRRLFGRITADNIYQTLITSIGADAFGSEPVVYYSAYDYYTLTFSNAAVVTFTRIQEFQKWQGTWSGSGTFLLEWMAGKWYIHYHNAAPQDTTFVATANGSDIPPAGASNWTITRASGTAFTGITIDTFVGNQIQAP